jgi:hypothetical protein
VDTGFLGGRRLSTAEHKTRRQLGLREKAGEFEPERCRVYNPLRLRSGRYNLPEDQACEYADHYGFPRSNPLYDCWRYARLSECCDSCHEYHDPGDVTLPNGEAVHLCCSIDRAIRPAYHARLRAARVEKDRSTADGHRFLATTWVSPFPFDDVTLFAWDA